MLRLFPEASDVFFDQIEEHRHYLLPIATLDLSKINKNRDGFLHFVQPIEPYDGAVGSNTRQFHTYYCRKNWVAYSVRNGKYKLLCDFCFFEKNTLRIPQTFVKHFMESNPILTHYLGILKGITKK